MVERRNDLVVMLRFIVIASNDLFSLKDSFLMLRCGLCFTAIPQIKKMQVSTCF